MNRGSNPVPRTLAEGGTREKNYFIFFARNPLKNPDSAKGIQGNPSLFPWIYLDLLGFIWPRGRSRFNAP
jgi:hypothetical protein